MVSPMPRVGQTVTLYGWRSIDFPSDIHIETIVHVWRTQDVQTGDGEVLSLETDGAWFVNFTAAKNAAVVAISYREAEWSSARRRIKNLRKSEIVLDN